MSLWHPQKVLALVKMQTEAEAEVADHGVTSVTDQADAISVPAGEEVTLSSVAITITEKSSICAFAHVKRQVGTATGQTLRLYVGATLVDSLGVTGNLTGNSYTLKGVVHDLSPGTYTVKVVVYNPTATTFYRVSSSVAGVAVKIVRA